MTSFCRRPGFNPWVGKIPWRRERLPTPVFWPGEFHGPYSPWGCKGLDMTERLSHLLFLWASFNVSVLVMYCHKTDSHSTPLPKMINIYCVTFSGGQKLQSKLVGWFWLRFSHDDVVNLLAWVPIIWRLDWNWLVPKESSDGDVGRKPEFLVGCWAGEPGSLTRGISPYGCLTPNCSWLSPARVI